MNTENDSERMLDKTLADTFPASDPPSTMPNPSFDSFGSHQPAPEHMPYGNDALRNEAA